MVDKLLIWPHVPARLQTIVGFRLGTDNFLWYPADTIGTCSDAVKLLGRHHSAVATDATRVRTVVAAFEARWRREVKSSERPRLPQEVPITDIS